MYTKLIILCVFLAIVKVYGEEGDVSFLNEVVGSEEKVDYEKKNRLNLVSAIRPLSPIELKCFVWNERHCTTYTAPVKNALIQAVKEDCAKCSSSEKEKAGQAALSLMVHHPVAWKHFLTEHDALDRIQRP